MGQPVDAKLIPAVAREVCQRTASAAVLDGSIAKIGTQYLLTLKAVNCESGRNIGEHGGTGKRREPCAEGTWKRVRRNAE